MNDERSSELERELNALYYSISHDLRAPLRAIDGFSQAVLEDHGPNLDDDGRRCLERVCTAARKMTAMIDGLLEISRLNRDPLQRRSIDLSAMASGIVDELKKTDARRTITWDSGPALLARADPGLARILLAALLDNAWKFTAGRDPAEIRLFATPGGFCLSDNGVGFDSTHAARLFSPFQRMHPPERFPGLGLGLAGAARIVARHGGRIHAESQPEAGTRVYFSLEPSAMSGEPNADS